jgi:hypothetical protein
MLTIWAVFIIGLAIQIWIESRPNSQVNQLAKEIADAIKESRKH